MAKLNNPDYNRAKTFHEFTVFNLKGEQVQLENYKGHLCIVVNIATKSNFTSMHYKQFNELIEKFGESRGLRILAFPCNQFGQEEPGTAEEIAAHAEANNVLFDIFAKVDVNGENASPVWKFMKHHLETDSKKGNMIKWNYTKIIVNKVGIPVEKHGPEVEPHEFETLLNPYCRGHRHRWLHPSTRYRLPLDDLTNARLNRALASMQLRRHGVSAPRPFDENNELPQRRKRQNRF